eukprot:TRINITY_DN54_c0_g1_i4.p1 TRINITY_DN54_c0_g1~~TRINITY_DN54_c0_g1_i4.p1  ORF type:complete len:183 (-),score=71.47 TRINITY_DN54_c0_g1_i4:121-669(-)
MCIRDSINAEYMGQFYIENFKNFINMNPFMELAVKEAFDGLKNKHGGPFGACIVKDGKVLVSGHNMVVCTNDPTAHAEVTVIRKASQLLKRFDLSDCEVYTSCEPCPMCLSAIMWAKIKKVYYGCTKTDARDINFDDKFIYDYIEKKLSPEEMKRMECFNIDRDKCLGPFKQWQEQQDKVQY